MIRRIIGLVICASLLVACTPELIPRPVTPQPSSPTAIPPTETPAPISAPVVASPKLTAIHMLDENSGWGISETQVVRTIDGGVTWYNVGPKDVAQLGYAALSAFLDAQHGWVLVADPKDMLKGTLYRTADGGASWDSIAVPFGGGDMKFLDAKNGWMMAGLGAAMGSMAIAVYRTNDGGSTWTESYVNDPNVPNAGSSLPLSGLKNGLAATNMQTAWISGTIYTPGVIYLYRSDDGGATWQQVPVQIPNGYDQAMFDALPPRFASSATAFLPITASSQNGVMLTIYVSRDGGNTWVGTPTMVPQGGQTDFIDAKNGFVWNGTAFYVTHDGAQTWTTVTPDIKFTDSFAGMDFVSASKGWIITNDGSGGYALYVTTDGGATWNILDR